jgi:hypothetical protein
MEDTDMVVFVLAAALLVGVANMAFHQGQDNPDAKSFFGSKSDITSAE